MNLTKTPQVLKDLVANTKSNSAMISSTDGLSMFSEFNTDLDEDKVAASTAVILSVAQSVSKDILKGGLEQITFQTDKGNLVIQAISDDAFLSLFTDSDTDPLLIKKEMKATINYINEKKIKLAYV